MLQQTQVERVIPRWLAWLERWPTPRHARRRLARRRDQASGWGSATGARSACTGRRRSSRPPVGRTTLRRSRCAARTTPATIRQPGVRRAVLPIDTNVARIRGERDTSVRARRRCRRSSTSAQPCAWRACRAATRALAAHRRLGRRVRAAAEAVALRGSFRQLAGARCLRLVAAEAQPRRRALTARRAVDCALSARRSRASSAGEHRAACPPLDAVVHPDVGLDVDAFVPLAVSISTGTSASRDVGTAVGEPQYPSSSPSPRPSRESASTAARP